MLKEVNDVLNCQCYVYCPIAVSVDVAYSTSVTIYIYLHSWKKLIEEVFKFNSEIFAALCFAKCFCVHNHS